MNSPTTVSSSDTVAVSYGKDNPFPAKMLSRRLLCPEGAQKEIIHVVFDIAGSGMRYEAGDALGIYPVNREEDVEELLEVLGLDGETPVELPLLKLPGPLSLRTALRSKLSLSKPTQKFLLSILEKLKGTDERARAEKILANKEEVNAYLQEREYVDILRDFPSVRGQFSAQDFASNLRRLLPRLYSISSSPRVYPDQVHLTMSVVRYEMLGRKRYGVCSSYVADRAVVNESPVQIFVAHSHFRLPADNSKDVIMVGPGVGMAPFRGFLQDREASGARGRNWMFFGDRNEATGFLYREEWQKMLASGLLNKLSLAWSRDQPQKIYVQDLMRTRDARELWTWLKNGAYFYICGDAKRMAKDVDDALHDVIIQVAGMSYDEAEAYVSQMKKDGRYQRDVY